MTKESRSDAYAASGVDITAGYKAVELMKSHVAGTRTAGVLSDVGGFGGVFAPDLTGMKEPVLVSGTDGVGTKLKLAFIADRHDTIGIDCVAMCVNDIICAGAKPMFFLDYIACGKNVPERIAQIVKGVSEGCIQSGCALVGGETAEMPGFYPEDEYDLAGFAVGIADRSKLLDSGNVSEGDIIIALPSSGVHSNGFSLVRKVYGLGFGVDPHQEEALRNDPDMMKIIEKLLTPTKIYVKPVLALMEEIELRSIAHITGGGFYENIPRALPEGLCARIRREDVRVLPLFDDIAAKGNISEHDMFNTFNMGVGMICIVSPGDRDRALEILAGAGEDAYVLGEIIRSDQGVILC